MAQLLHLGEGLLELGWVIRIELGIISKGSAGYLGEGVQEVVDEEDEGRGGGIEGSEDRALYDLARHWH